MKKKKDTQKPTRYLKKAGRELWRSIAKGWQLNKHHLTILQSLCETVDKKNQAEMELRAGKLTYRNRHGEFRPNPLVAIIRDCNTTIARLIRELNLSEQAADNRPPGLKYSG